MNPLSPHKHHQACQPSPYTASNVPLYLSLLLTALGLH